jgi:predicted GIY-YIG superfamily endonuclease
MIMPEKLYEPSKKYALYRIKNDEGKSIYIGISGTAMRRVADHIDNKKWQSEISSIDVEYFDNKIDAEMSEILAVKRYRPKYNGTYNNSEPAKSAVKKKIMCYQREAEEFVKNSDHIPTKQHWRIWKPSEEELLKHKTEFMEKRGRKAVRLLSQLEDCQKWWEWAVS